MHGRKKTYMYVSLLETSPTILTAQTHTNLIEDIEYLHYVKFSQKRF